VRGLTNLLPLLLLGVLFWALLIRPQRNRQREAQALLTRVGPGDEVLTSAGMFGTVVDVVDDTVSLEVSPGVRMRFAKGAITRIIPPASDAPVLDAPAYDEDEDAAGNYPADGPVTDYRDPTVAGSGSVAGSDASVDESPETGDGAHAAGAGYDPARYDRR